MSNENKSGVLKLGSKKVILELCPKCKKEYLNPIEARNALSRKGNYYVCNHCGILEALEEAKDAGLI